MGRGASEGGEAAMSRFSGQSGDELLRISHLTKYFGDAKALDDVSFLIRRGEIHGLVGQNGSGKSTLIKCLSGYHSQDLEWVLELPQQRLTRPLHPGEITSFGVSFVHQDLGVLPELSVLENLLLVGMADDHRAFIPWKAERRRVSELFERFGLDLDPSASLASLRPVEQAQVAIIRAVLQLRGASSADHPGVLVLDEATTFLDRVGREGLYSLLRSVAEDGAGVVFVSHDIEEVRSLCDWVTVLRDGKVVADDPIDKVSHDEMVSLIVTGTRDSTVTVVSRRDGSDQRQPTGDGTRHYLRVVDMSSETIDEVGFEAAGGEIIGITGIVGSGWEFVLEHLFGARSAETGWIEIDGLRHELPEMEPTLAIEHSMVFVPSDRLRQGIIAELSVEQNVMLPVLGQLFRGGRLRIRELASRALHLVGHYGIQPAQPRRTIGSLSGGNQQKAVLGKWLQLKPAFVLLNEPTQGVDVGARQRIYELVRSAAGEGAVVLYATGDWEEVSHLADRVVVIADGHVAAELGTDEVSVEAIAKAAYQGTRKSADLSKAGSLWEGS